MLAPDDDRGADEKRGNEDDYGAQQQDGAESDDANVFAAGRHRSVDFAMEDVGDLTRLFGEFGEFGRNDGLHPIG